MSILESTFVNNLLLISWLVFPLTFANVYNPDPVQIGLKGLGYGISVTAGAVIVNWLLSLFKNNNRELMIASCVVMSESSPCLALELC